MKNAILWGMALSALSLPVQAMDAESQKDMRAELEALKAQLEKLEPLRQRVHALESRLAEDTSGKTASGQQTQLAQGIGQGSAEAGDATGGDASGDIASCGGASGGRGNGSTDRQGRHLAGG